MNDFKHTMETLKANHSGLTQLIPQDKPVVFLGYPIHLNVGDSLIALGTEQFFKDYGYKVIHRATLQNFTFKSLPPEATIVFQGGGNFGDLYYHYDQSWREKVVEHYPNNRIVILPISSDYAKDSPNLPRSKQIFNSHNDLHICLRDKVSEAFTKTHFNNTYLFPDMAQSLWGVLPNRTKPTKGTLSFIRKDKEHTGIPNSLTPQINEAYDWEDLFNVIENATNTLLRRIARVEGIVGFSIVGHKPWYGFRDNFIRKSVSFFNPYESVITNRLHGSILGCLLGKKVQAFNNMTGKITAYHSTWFEGSKQFKIVTK